MATATLSDGKTSYNFLLDPEEIQWSYQANYSNNSVLATSAPDIRWQSSVSSFSCPIRFLSQGMTQDMGSKIKPLADWCLTGAILKFSYGAVVIPRCLISRLSVTEKQWRSGKTTQADASIEFVVCRVPAPIQVDVRGKYTPREQLKIKQKALEKIKNPAFRRKYALGSSRYDVSVQPDGTVFLKSSKGTKKLPSGVFA